MENYPFEIVLEGEEAIRLEYLEDDETVFGTRKVYDGDTDLQTVASLPQFGEWLTANMDGDEFYSAVYTGDTELMQDAVLEYHPEAENPVKLYLDGSEPELSHTETVLIDDKPAPNEGVLTDTSPR